MPAISPNELVRIILDAIIASGGSGAYVSETVRTHPRKFVFSLNGINYSLWIYIWTVTHGGRNSLPNEYRIQMTSVISPLPMNPNGFTALLGFYPDTGVFACFDISRHSNFTQGSPSVQIDVSVLDAALAHGIAFGIKDNDEIVISVRADMFLSYLLCADDLHMYGHDALMMNMLGRVVNQQDVTEQEIATLQAPERRRVVSLVSRCARDQAFKRIVLNAYENRCAVTRMQLKLVQAAHILPVSSEDSIDNVVNGIALSPTYHVAYDAGLIYLDDNFRMIPNMQKLDQLRALDLYSGYDNFFSNFLHREIHLPFDVAQRPNLEFIRMANRFRMIPGY